MPSKRRETAAAFLDGFKVMTIDALMAYRAPNCTHQIVPSSLSLPPMDNEAYTAHLTRMLGVIKACPFIVKELVEDEAANKIVMWCTAHVTFHEDVGVYNGEYMVLLEFDESGEKLVRVVEFVDSAASIKFVGQIEEAKRLKESREKKEEA